MEQPNMTEVNELVESILNNEDYDLDLYGMDVNHVVDVAVDEQMPFWWNEDWEDSLRIALTNAYEKWWDEISQEYDDEYYM